MSGANSFKFVLLPPQSDTTHRPLPISPSKMSYRPKHSGRPADVSRGKSMNHAGSEENVVVGWQLSSISRIKFLCINFSKTANTRQTGNAGPFSGFSCGLFL